MNLVAEATNIHGLIVYLVGMILIGGAMTWANYIDHQRDKRRQARALQRGDDGPSTTSGARIKVPIGTLRSKRRGVPVPVGAACAPSAA